MSDDHFVNRALDPAKRGGLVGELERTRSVAKWIMALGVLEALVIALLGARPEAAFGGVFIVLVGSITFGQTDPKIKLLKVLARQEMSTEAEDVEIGS